MNEIDHAKHEARRLLAQLKESGAIGDYDAEALGEEIAVLEAPEALRLLQNEMRIREEDDSE